MLNSPAWAALHIAMQVVPARMFFQFFKPGMCPPIKSCNQPTALRRLLEDQRVASLRLHAKPEDGVGDVGEFLSGVYGECAVDAQCEDRRIADDDLFDVVFVE